MAITLDVSSIKFTKRDHAKEIQLPTELTIDLAYDVGVHIADGCMNAYPVKTGIDYYYKCSGNPETEKEWYDEILFPLKKKLFNYCTIPTLLGDGTYGFRFRSKAILEFYRVIIGLPFGKKSETIEIPAIIFNDPELRLWCLRGIFDADGYASFKKRYRNIHYYPYLGFGTKSKLLSQQIQFILADLKVPYSTCYRTGFDSRTNKNFFIYATTISGKKRFNLFKIKIGFRVSNDLAKISIWEKFGFCPPGLNLNQKKEILSGKKNILSYYNGKGEIRTLDRPITDPSHMEYQSGALPG